MFLYLNKAEENRIRVTANEGRGNLSSARIIFRHLTSEKTIELELANISTHPARYDEFLIPLGDLEALEAGDLLYSIYASEGGDIDPDIPLETGRARIRESWVQPEIVRAKNQEDVIYERS